MFLAGYGRHTDVKYTIDKYMEKVLAGYRDRSIYGRKVHANIHT